MHAARRLGVLGGMGPLAGAVFLQRLTLLTPVAREQEHIPALLWSDPRVPDRTLARLADGEDPLPWLRHGITALEAAGCGAIAIPCNTAHGWYASIQAATRLPILHIVDAAQRELLRLRVAPGPVGLMATKGTLAMGLYQERLAAQGWRCLVPTEEEMDRIVMPAISFVKTNRVADAYAPLVAMAHRLVERGATAVLLGCTEIPLGVGAGPTLPFPVVDSLDALARAALAWAKPQAGEAIEPLAAPR